MSKSKEIIEEFLLKKQLLEGFQDKVNSLLKDLLYLSQIKPHQIICRVKEKDSLIGKIDQKKDKYSELNQITDLVGIRIITYFDDEVDRISSIIEKEFEIDKENSVDKRIIEADRFGYKSLHYVVSLTKERLNFTETKIYSGLKAEIQIRSILQHAWAEIEHDIGYKGEFEIPKFAKRGFYRIAALLETADIEFVKLKDSLKKYESEIVKNIENKPDKVLIDKASLINFIYESEIVKKVEKNMQNIFPTLIIQEDKEPNVPISLRILNYFNISTIKELKSELDLHGHQMPLYFKLFAGGTPQLIAARGLPIFYLGYILAGAMNDIEKVLDYCKNVGLGSNKAFAQKIIDVYDSSKHGNKQAV